MKTFRKLLLFFIFLILLISGSYYWFKKADLSPKEQDLPFVVTYENKGAKLTLPENKNAPPPAKEEIVFVGPRENLPKDAPTAYGFWSFSYPIRGVLSRSGQPTIEEFRWLKKNGWKGIVNMREDIDRGEQGDDSKIPGFKELGFNYLHLPTADGAAPTNEDAEKFLAFVQDPANQPVHVHCRGGIGRAGVMVALARIKLQGWPLDKAVEESRLYKGGISDNQLKWLKKYLGENSP